LPLFLSVHIGTWFIHLVMVFGGMTGRAYDLGRDIVAWHSSVFFRVMDEWIGIGRRWYVYDLDGFGIVSGIVV
jgi:hypothetical protein